MADELNNNQETNQENQIEDLGQTPATNDSETSEQTSSNSESGDTNTSTVSNNFVTKNLLEKDNTAKPYKYFIKKINGVPVEDPYISQFFPNNLDPTKKEENTIVIKKDLNELKETVDEYKNKSIIPIDDTKYLFSNNRTSDDKTPILRKDGTKIIWTGQSIDKGLSSQLDDDTYETINTDLETGKIYVYSDGNKLSGLKGWNSLDVTVNTSLDGIVAPPNNSTFYYAGEIEKKSNQNDSDFREYLYEKLQNSDPGTLYNLKNKYIVTTIRKEDNIQDDGFDSIYASLVIEPNTMIFVKDIDTSKSVVKKCWGLFGTPRKVETAFNPESDNPPSCKAISDALNAILTETY